MGWLRTFCAVGLWAALVSCAAAADMPNSLPPPAPEWHAPALIDFNSGWYLRGDLGYSWGRLDGADAATGFINPTDSTLGNGMNGGGGVGIKTRWLRTDLTVDYLAPLSYSGTIAAPGDVTAKISAVSALLNGYLDLGTWYHITPYIGAGAGAAYVRVTDYTGSLSPPFSDGTRGQWNFAYAAMIGFGYKVAPNIMVDFGYRYLHLGDVATASDSFGAMTFKNVAAQEVRVGLRWSFDDLAER